MKTCSNCQGIVKQLQKTFCYKCFDRYKKYGDPNAGDDFRERLTNLPEKLTEQQYNVFIALMLGDGHLDLGKTKNANASLAINRAIKDIEYLQWQHSLYDNICTKKSFRTRHYFDNRTNKWYDGCSLYTVRLPLFTKYHKKWYNNNTKIIPNGLVLNAEIIAHWIADDGSLSLNEKGDRIYLNLCTNSFTKDETYFLRDLLSDRYNEHYTVSTFSHAEQYVIRCADSASRTLLADIDPVFPITMSRKIIWKDILKNDLPRYESRTVGHNRRTNAIIQYLSCTNTFTLREMNDTLKLYPPRADGGFAPSNQIFQYIKDYIENDYIIKHERAKGSDYAKGRIYMTTPAGKQFFQSELKR